MQVIEFKIRGEFIELIKLLKATGLSENGAQAQLLVEQKGVKVNGSTETRKRAKIRPGDVIETPAGTVRTA
jgi:ribosome-associated protein